MFDVNDFTPILSWQNKVNLDEYQRWVRSVEMNSSDYGSIENIIFLLQKYIFDTDFEYFSWDYDDESEVTKNKWQAAKMVITIASKIVNRHELKPLVLTIMAQNYIVLGKWDKAIECYTAALNEYDSREDKNDIFNPPSSKDYTSEEQSAVLSIIHNIGIIYYLTGQNSKEYALSSKYARILQLEERTTENFNREYPTMRGRVPSRCDFSNGMLYYEESFVEGIQTTNTLAKDNSFNDYGQEAIDTILKAMEDHRDDLVVIVAGYPGLMERFINSNPGLKSRFNRYITFEDYTPSELLEIFESMCKKSGYTTDYTVDHYVLEYFTNKYNHRDDFFANGREVRNFFERAAVNQANRLAIAYGISGDDIAMLTLEDVEQA